MVAKSYQQFPVICEPYERSGRYYVEVLTRKGSKEVRWYSNEEYMRMYPEDFVLKCDYNKAFGFYDQYITVFFGAPVDSEFFSTSPARYNKNFGWYLSSKDSIVDPIPEGVKAVKILWEDLINSDMCISLTAQNVCDFIASFDE